MKLFHTKRRILAFLLYRFSILPGQMLVFIPIFLYARFVKTGDWNGIQLIHEPNERPRLKEVVSALELIQKTNARRYRRIQQFIKRVVLFRWRQLGVYYVIGRVCGIRLLSEAKGEKEVLTYAHASILIHEATHGYLEHKRFPYSKKNKKQIERICLAEQERFLANAPRHRSELRNILRRNCLPTDHIFPSNSSPSDSADRRKGVTH